MTSDLLYQMCLDTLAQERELFSLLTTSKMHLATILSFYFLTYNLTEDVTVTKAPVSTVFVKVKNISFPVASGKFLLYEQAANEVILNEYPAFYYEGKELNLETPIQNSHNQTIGYIIGHDNYYYPITPRKEKMYCGYYNIEDFVGNRDLFYRQKKYSSIADLKAEVRPPIETMCFIYVTV